jgi:hypothetical protein
MISPSTSKKAVWTGGKREKIRHQSLQKRESAVRNID